VNRSSIYRAALGLGLLVAPLQARAQDAPQPDQDLAGLGQVEGVKDLLIVNQDGRELHFTGPDGKFLNTFNQNGSNQNMFFWELAGGTGAALEKADDVLLAQLGLPAGEGVVVRKVQANSPASRAGIQPLDILRSIDGKPLKSVEDATKLFEAAEAPVPVELVRKGKPMQVQFKPEKKEKAFRYWIADQAHVGQSEFWIGVEVSPVDDTLRSHLNIPAQQGLVVTWTHNGGPADRAGIRANDILVEIGGKALSNSADLVNEIKAAGEKPTKLTLIRAGKQQTAEVTPEKRDAQHKFLFRANPEGTNSDVWLQFVRPGFVLKDGKVQENDALVHHMARATVATHDAAALTDRLDQVINELKELRKSVDALQKAAKKD
jgi:hypothetical protein